MRACGAQHRMRVDVSWPSSPHTAKRRAADRCARGRPPPCPLRRAAPSAIWRYGRLRAALRCLVESACVGGDAGRRELKDRAPARHAVGLFARAVACKDLRRDARNLTSRQLGQHRLPALLDPLGLGRPCRQHLHLADEAACAGAGTRGGKGGVTRPHASGSNGRGRHAVHLLDAAVRPRSRGVPLTTRRAVVRDARKDGKHGDG